MLAAVHTAWLISWQYQRSRTHFGSSIDPFESWDRVMALMGLGHPFGALDWWFD